MTVVAAMPTAVVQIVKMILSQRLSIPEVTGDISVAVARFKTRTGHLCIEGRVDMTLLLSGGDRGLHRCKDALQRSAL